MAKSSHMSVKAIDVRVSQHIPLESVYSAKGFQVILDRNMMYLVDLFILDDVKRLQEVLDDERYRQHYFTTDFCMHYMGIKAILTEAWACLEAIVRSCRMTDEVLRTLYSYTCVRIERMLNGKGKKAMTLTDVFSPAATVRQRVEWETYMAKDHSAVLDLFHRVCNILACATNIKGHKLGMSRGTVLDLLGRQLAPLLLEPDDETPTRHANALIGSYLSLRELVIEITIDLRCCHDWNLLYLPPIEHLWDAVIRLMCHSHDMPHIKRLFIDAAIRRHAELVRDLQPKVAVHLIPDLANLVTTWFQAEHPRAVDDDANRVSYDQSVKDKEAAASYRLRLINNYFPLTQQQKTTKKNMKQNRKHKHKQRVNRNTLQ
jgi:hypothetical protein